MAGEHENAVAGGSVRPLNQWKEAGMWTWAEIELLGTDTDEAIAARLGRTVAAVKLKRQRRGIAKWNPIPKAKEKGGK